MCFKEEKEDTFKLTEDNQDILIIVIEYIDDILFLLNSLPELEETDTEEINTNT